MRSNRSANSLASPGRWSTAWTPGRVTTISAACQGTLSVNSLVAHRVEHPRDPGTLAHLHLVERRNRDCQRLSPLKTHDRARLESQRPLRLASPRQELQPGAKVQEQRSLQPRLPRAIQKYGTCLVLAGCPGESSIHAQEGGQNQKANGHASSVLDVVFMTLILRTVFPSRQAFRKAVSFSD